MAKQKDKSRKSALLTWKGSAVQSRVPEPSLSSLTKAQVVEIPSEYDVVPAIDWSNGRPRMYRVAVKKTSISGDFPVTKKRTRKSA